MRSKVILKYLYLSNTYQISVIVSFKYDFLRPTLKLIGLVVSVVAFYCGDPSLSLAEQDSFSVN